MAWAAGGTCVGGVVGGPPGALLGGIAGRYIVVWYNLCWVWEGLISPDKVFFFLFFVVVFFWFFFTTENLIFFLFLLENVCCGYSSEVPQ